MDIKEKIIKILEERLNLEIEKNDYTIGQKLLFSEDETSGYGLDSVDALEIVVGLQGEFGISLRNEENLPEIMKNIDSLTEYVERKVA